MAMVTLDHVLLHEARQLITGSNIHKLKEMIFVYEQAVSLHNSGCSSHRMYQSEYERNLRKFVVAEKLRRSQSYREIFSSGDTRELRAPSL